MTVTRNLTADERAAVFARIKPVGGFKAAQERKPFGMQPVPWEDKLGNLDDWRSRAGQGRAIAPVLSSEAKTQSVRSSIVGRLKKVYPGESWSTFVDNKQIFLRYNGKIRSYATRQRLAEVPREQEEQNELFATG